jgi:hypothetical protein
MVLAGQQKSLIEDEQRIETKARACSRCCWRR